MAFGDCIEPALPSLTEDEICNGFAKCGEPGMRVNPNNVTRVMIWLQAQQLAFETALAGPGGAGLIGTLNGFTVQEMLDALEDATPLSFADRLPEFEGGAYLFDRPVVRTGGMVIKNELSAVPISPNLIGPSSQAFEVAAGQGIIFTCFGGSMVLNDNAAVAMNGEMEATIFEATGDWAIRMDAVNLPAGDYTVGIVARQHSGALNKFDSAHTNEYHVPPRQTLGADYQRFPTSFTTAGGSGALHFAYSSQAALGVSMEIDHVFFYTGLVDLEAAGRTPHAGHIYLGAKPFDTKVDYIDTPGGSYVEFVEEGGLATAKWETNQAVDFNNATVGYLRKKLPDTSGQELGVVVANLDASGAEPQANALRLAFPPRGDQLAYFADGDATLQKLIAFSGNNNFDPERWHFGFGSQSVSGRRTSTLNNTPFGDLTITELQSAPYYMGDPAIPWPAATSAKCKNLIIGATQDLFNGFSNLLYTAPQQLGAVIISNRVLTYAEETQCRKAVAREFSVYGTITPVLEYGDHVIRDGDSINGQGPTNSSILIAAPLCAPKRPTVSNMSVQGAKILDVWNRAHAKYGDWPERDTETQRSFVQVLIGANDLTNARISFIDPTKTGTTGWLYDLEQLFLFLQSKGFRVIATTVTPKADAVFNTARNIVNTEIRTWEGDLVVAVADYAADPTYGTDAAGFDVGKYPDGVHPNNAAIAALAVIDEDTLNAALALP